MTYRVKNITIAVALALVAALLTSFYVTNYQRNVRKDETNVPIFVAARDIPAGTSGTDLVKKGLVEKSEIVRRSEQPAAAPESTTRQCVPFVVVCAIARMRASRIHSGSGQPDGPRCVL